MSKKSKFLKTKEESTNQITESEVSKVLEFNIKEYGMSVIEDRMIPSIRDGLKPSQRRLLKAMYDLKAWNTAPTVKSARVTGDCFTGDTSIIDVNGNEILISDLYEKISRGDAVYTFSSKADGTIVAAKVVKCWVASEVNEIVEVTLDNNESFRCTKDHRILSRDGTYIEAGNLDEGTSLMPVYMKVVSTKGWDNNKSIIRRMIKDNKRDKFLYVYRITSLHPDSLCEEVVDDVVHTHHIDFDSLNDTPTNLVRLSAKKHITIHDSKSFHEYNTNGSLSNRDKEQWKDENYKKYMSECVTESNFRRSEKFHKERKESLSALLSENETIFSIYDKLGHKGLLEILSSDSLKEKYRLEEDCKYFDKRYSNGHDTLTGNLTKVVLLLLELRDSNLDLTVDNVKAIRKKRNYTYFYDAYYIAENYENLINDIGIKVNLPEVYEYPATIVGNSRKLQLFNSAIRILSKLNAEGLDVNEENWTNSMKHSNEVGYKKFMSDPIYEELRPAPYNHKVKSVRFIHLEHKISVYNIEVDSDEHNFALACGTFAKNCMGKYHPHSEAYGALGGLVNQTYSLVQGQGNWGSLDDEPAAPRYTECRFSKLGQRCFESYEVADEVPNFSGEYMEPIDIPMDFPMFFVNGGTGIGVAVRLETLDHNLEEIVDALKIVLKKGEKTKMEDLFKVFHGPDSVYGGKLLTSKEELREIYETGTGKVSYECDYTITPQGRDKYLLTVTGYCPGFKPSKFQNAMIKLMSEKYVLDANDASTKENVCNFQVVYQGEDTFESKIHKNLICTQNVQYYALDRQKSKNPELRDVDTVLLQKSFIEYMKIWLDWRREQEGKLLDIRAKEIDDKMFHVECRMCAAENLKVIQAALNADDAVSHLMNNLPYLMGHPRAKEGAEYILDLKIGSIKKTDMQKMRLEFGALDQELQRVNKDKNDIDKVVARKLDSLKEFFKPRMLKVQE